MGPNGSGKSTLIGILSTLSRPTSGEVHYNNSNHGEAERDLRGRIGVIAHAPMLYAQLSGRENLRFFARMYGLPHCRERVELLLQRVGMQAASEKPIGKLSRGLIQHLALARALVTDPDLLLMDEPFTGLDRDATELLRGEIERASAAGTIVVIVTHDAGAVDGLCDQLLVLRSGRLAADISEPRLTRAGIQERYHAAS